MIYINEVIKKIMYNFAQTTTDEKHQILKDPIISELSKNIIKYRDLY